jgi:hypothetical protein
MIDRSFSLISRKGLRLTRPGKVACGEDNEEVGSPSWLTNLSAGEHLGHNERTYRQTFTERKVHRYPWLAAGEL